jgi:hypothetical protein
MSDLSQTVPTEARRERRRLHLREVAELPATVEQLAVVEEPVDLLPAVPSSTVGELLRAARLSRGEEASSVAALLKMRREQLEAVEAGDLAKLPGRTTNPSISSSRRRRKSSAAPAVQF